MGLLGRRASDDAVLRINGDQAIAQTVDFFTPIVDDPYLRRTAARIPLPTFTRWATPILGLAIAAFRSAFCCQCSRTSSRGVTKEEAGFPVAGGHTIIDDDSKYPAVTGVVAVDKIIRTDFRPNTSYLTKPIGNGILVCAYRALSRKRLRRNGPPDSPKRRGG
jgi:selenide,water dikinase